MDSPEEVQQAIDKHIELFASQEFNSYFKYCSDSPEVLESIFKSQKMRFTQPRALNDPLEFAPTMRFRNDQAKYQSYEINGVSFPSTELFFRVQLIESQINKYGILSLTKIPDSFDMWSQYANGHRGFLIEFNHDFPLISCMRSNDSREYPVRRVQYVNDYAINIEDVVNSDNEIPLEALHNELFYKKTSRWKHEDEYRMVRPLTDCPDYQPPRTRYAYTDVGVYLFPFTWDCVASVVLGANMSPENKSFIAQFCEDHNIPLHQAHVVRDHNDRFGKLGAVILLRIDDSESKGMILKAHRQLFCTDTLRISHRNHVVKISSLSQLPYYAGYEEVVREFLKNTNGEGGITI